MKHTLLAPGAGGLDEKDLEGLKSYKFHTKVVDWRFCGNCGSTLVGMWAGHGSIVNVSFFRFSCCLV